MSADRLQGIYAYLSVVFRAAILIFQSLVAGGVVFLAVALKAQSGSDFISEVETAKARCIRLLRISALLLAVSHAGYLFINCSVLIGSEDLSLSDIFGANFVIAAFIGIGSAWIIAQFALFFQRRIWPLIMLTILALSSSVMTNHASARMDGRIWLVPVTALHVAAAAAWIGGLPYLWTAVAAARAEIASSFAKRFSYIATASVAILAASGFAATLKYVDSAAGIYGTSYGVMLGAKVFLFAMLLLLGAVNHEAIRKLPAINLVPRLKRCVEAEIMIGITALLAAASLTSQPPAVDLKNDRASLSAIFERLRPTWPRLKTPDLKDISPATRHLSDKAGIVGTSSGEPAIGTAIATPNTPADIAWSEYNHNWVGLMILAIGVLALLSRSTNMRLARHWPLIFLVLAVFIFVRADPENWPLGPNGFWESFDQIEVVQHRAAALMVVAFALFEWRVQKQRTRSPIAPLIFPAVCILGGALLLTHTHALQNSKDQVLAELSHTPLALLAVVAGCMRWLELRLPRNEVWIPAKIWPVCFMLIGALLLTYKEG